MKGHTLRLAFSSVTSGKFVGLIRAHHDPECGPKIGSKCNGWPNNGRAEESVPDKGIMDMERATQRPQKKAGKWCSV